MKKNIFILALVAMFVSANVMAQTTETKAPAKKECCKDAKGDKKACKDDKAACKDSKKACCKEAAKCDKKATPAK